MSAAELAGGFAVPAPVGLSGSIEDGFRRRLDALPADTRRLLQLAAADPVGEPLLVWRAAERLGIHPEAATPAVDADLLEIGAQVRFRHPLVRSAAYRSASPAERYALHAALAEATDAEIDPDRRAWHRAQAAAGPDEEVAAELERSAARAQARGGIAAAAAFLESAATLTPDPAERVRRLLAAARAKRDAGALEAALQLLTAAEAGPMSALQAAEVEHLRGRGRVRSAPRRRRRAAARRRGQAIGAAGPRAGARDAPRGARRGDLGRDLDSPGALVEAAEAARAAPPAPDPPGAVDVVLDALALRLTEGYAAAAPALEQALETVLALEAPAGDLGRWLWLTGARATGLIALELWDADAWHELASRQVRVARESGALVQLQFALNFFARSQLASGRADRCRGAHRGGARDRAGDGQPGGGVRGDAARGVARPGAARVRADRAHGAGGERARARQDGRRRDLREGGALQRPRPLRRGARRRARGVRAPRPRGIRPVRRRRAGRGGIEDGRSGARRGRARVAVGAHARDPHRLGCWGSRPASARCSSDGDAAERRVPRVDRAPRTRTRLRMELARGHLLYGEWLRREAPPGGRARAAARRPRAASRDRRRRLRRARAARAARDRRDGPQAPRRHARRAHAAGGAHRAPRASPAGRTRRSAPSSSSARAPSSGT